MNCDVPSHTPTENTDGPHPALTYAHLCLYTSTASTLNKQKYTSRCKYRWASHTHSCCIYLYAASTLNKNSHCHPSTSDGAPDAPARRKRKAVTLRALWR